MRSLPLTQGHLVFCLPHNILVWPLCHMVWPLCFICNNDLYATWGCNITFPSWGTGLAKDVSAFNEVLNLINTWCWFFFIKVLGMVVLNLTSLPNLLLTPIWSHKHPPLARCLALKTSFGLCLRFDSELNLTKSHNHPKKCPSCLIWTLFWAMDKHKELFEAMLSIIKYNVFLSYFNLNLYLNT